MNLIVDLSSSLSSDYEKLYDGGRYTDISIHVGSEPNNKIFLAHTVVLCTRSRYLERKITDNTEISSDNQQTAISLDDMTPDIFEVLLR